MADPEIVRQIGKYFKQMRLNQNLSQKELAEIAGVGRATISRLENGTAATLMTVIEVLRALKKLDLLNIFQEEARISPIQLLRLQNKQRQRASSPRENKEEQ